jgi:hypothetical protein
MNHITISEGPFVGTMDFLHPLQHGSTLQLVKIDPDPEPEKNRNLLVVRATYKINGEHADFLNTNHGDFTPAEILEFRNHFR